MAVTVIIPARLASTRFPEKVLAAKTGKPLVQHVVEGAATTRGIDRVVVATDHPRVADALRPFGTHVVMTRADHPNGTSRLAEASRLLNLGPEDIVVNAQGDEPEMAGEVIEAALRALAHPGASVGTVAAPFAPGLDPRSPHLVKVVRGLDGCALYFSRALIPVHRDAGAGAPAPVQPWRHVGVYAYQAAFLERYAGWPSTPLERSEQLEQLRVLEHGFRVGVELCSAAPEGIDTPEQYAAFVARYRAPVAPAEIERAPSPAPAPAARRSASRPAPSRRAHPQRGTSGRPACATPRPRWRTGTAPAPPSPRSP